MEEIQLSDMDLQQMEQLGISRSQLLDQIRFFHKESSYVRLSRPCTLGDGVRQVPAAEAEEYVRLHQGAVRSGRFTKFVPASGAATRMFQSLLQIFYLPHFLEKGELERKARQGVAVACDFLRFMEAIGRFAFFDDLRDVLARNGFEIEELIQEHQFRTILEFLLTERGLNYGSLPKALLKFHSYPEGCRTAFEEHLAESALYMAWPETGCPVHFTINHDHEKHFRRLFSEIGSLYERRFNTSFDIRFSFQKLSTNTVAAEMDNQLFRDRFGRLHFRPAGHGALLENLNELKGDLIYIKNVDNTVPDHLKENVSFWKRILGGYLVEVQTEAHSLVRRLKDPEARGAVEEAFIFSRENLLLWFPADFVLWPVERKREFLLSRLDRPIRVCGMVPNAGEPGGAPFWVEDRRGGFSVQIVEKAQVDLNSPEQARIWNSSTHFNPVDIVCGVLDPGGRPYDLRRFVDPEAVIITKKSKDGKDIKALELPGLWNGGMAHWNTVLVEVPPSTFNPVKSVYDLLRPEHQPETEDGKRRTEDGEQRTESGDRKKNLKSVLR